MFLAWLHVLEREARRDCAPTSSECRCIQSRSALPLRSQRSILSMRSARRTRACTCFMMRSSMGKWGRGSRPSARCSAAKRAASEGTTNEMQRPSAVPRPVRPARWMYLHQQPHLSTRLQSVGNRNCSFQSTLACNRTSYPSRFAENTSRRASHTVSARVTQFPSARVCTTTTQAQQRTCLQSWAAGTARRSGCWRRRGRAPRRPSR